MGGGDGKRWLFGEFELTPDHARLLKEGVEINVARKPLAVLAYLAANRHRVVPREELLDTVWDGVSVSDAAFASVLRDLRRVLGDTGGRPGFVATLRGRGLRFVHELEEVEPGEGAASWETLAFHFERALRALELVESSRGSTGELSPSAPRERGSLLVALARARWAGGATHESRKIFLDAADAARRAGDAEMLARAALGFTGRTDATPGGAPEAIALLEEALAGLSGDSMVRAEVLARLGTEVAGEDDALSDRLTEEAVSLAERVGDASVLAYTLTARHFVMQRPEVALEARRSLVERAIDLLSDGGASDVLAIASQEQLFDLLEAGEGVAFEAALERYSVLVKELAQPFFAWVGSLYAGTRALLRDELDEAERLAHVTLKLGQRVRSPNAAAVFAGQLFGVRREQGRLAELAPPLDQLRAETSGFPIVAAARAAVTAAAGTQEEARTSLEWVMSRDLADFPRDGNWIATLATLAPAALASGSQQRIRQLRGLLLPHSGRMAVVVQGTVVQGAVDHHLGLLEAALGERAVARGHLDSALALHERLGAAGWSRRSREARAAL